MPSRKCFCPVTHVIFDCDGTLMDSEVIYLRAVQEILDRFGITYNTTDHTHHLGMPVDTFSQAIVQEMNLPIKKEEFLEIFQSLSNRYLANVPLLPGVKDLILHLHEYRIPFCIATSSGRELFKLKAKPHKDIMLAFHHVVCGDDPQLPIGRGKPKPDIFLLAASRFNPPADPKKCLIFEDSPAGLRGGMESGSQVVFIPQPHVTKEQRKGATLVLKSMTEFKPELFGLPAFGNCSKFEFG